MDKLDAVIRALDVSRVVWIDDLFRSQKSNRGGDATSVAREIVAASRSEELGVSPQLESPIEVLAERLQNNPDLYQRAVAILVSIGTEPGADDDLRVISAIEGKLTCDVVKNSGASWKVKLAGTPETYTKTLFLVDRDFEQEGLDDAESDSLLVTTVSTYLVRDRSNYCVVLSKGIGESTEMRDRGILLKSILASQGDKKELLRFSAISKQALGQDPAGALANRLTSRLAGAVLVEMFDKMQQAMSDSVTELENVLVEDFDDVNKAVLVNSYNEGTSELDVLLRIVNQNHRLTLSNMMNSAQGESLRAILGRFRLFQLDHDVGVADYEIADSARLKNLARAEILTTGAQINRMHLPTVPGDVFVTLPAGLDASQALEQPYQDIVVGQKYWMLLGQLCDVVLRSKTGEAKAKMALLAQFKVIKGGDRDKFELKHQKDFQAGRRKCVSAADLALAFDFITIQTANVAALQFVAFDVNGVAQLAMNKPNNEIWSYASVARAKKNAAILLNGAAAVPELLEFYALGFDGADSSRKMKVSGEPGDRAYGYSIKRVCRIRDTEAVETFAALQRYWTRIAKPHDFTQ